MSTIASVVLPLRLVRPEGIHAATLCLAQMNLDQLQETQRIRPFLHPKELKRLESMQELRRQSYMAGRFCASKALTHQIGTKKGRQVLIEAGVFGQPLVGTPFGNVSRISISHSAEYACALAFDPAQPMGIDLEPTHLRHQAALRSQMTLAERNFLDSAWRHEHASVWLWTVKEALGKALLMGLTPPIWMYEVKTVKKNGHFLVSTFTHFIQYKALSFQWMDSLVSIVLPARTKLDIPLVDGIRPLVINDVHL